MIDPYNTTKTTDLFVQYGTALDTLSDEYEAQAITGQIDVDKTWDKYVNDFLKAGGEQIQEEQNKGILYEDVKAGRR